jgi:flagellar biosynthesis/type III secretory pathway chaperone
MMNDLVNVMSEQAVCYEGLLDLSKDKREALIKNDVEKLRQITELENNLIAKNISLEKRRLAIIEELAYILNEDPDALTVSRILSITKKDSANRDLLSISKKMRDIMEALKESNNANRILLERSIENVRFNINALYSECQDSILDVSR